MKAIGRRKLRMAEHPSSPRLLQDSYSNPSLCHKWDEIRPLPHLARMASVAREHAAPTMEGSGFDYTIVPLPRRRRDGGGRSLFTRILQLAPGVPGDPLRASLELIDIRNPRRTYEALSYRWGIDRDGLIECSGHNLRICANLACALEHLRERDSPRWLWNDFLCINQDDRDEKGDQISMMRWIFKYSHRVVVWVGPGSPSARDALDLVEEVAEERDRLTSGQVGPIFLSVDRLLESLLASGPPAVFRGGGPRPGLRERLLQRACYIRELLSSEWFQRVWCVQEVLVATSCVLLCGDRQTDFYNFISVAPQVVRAMSILNPRQFSFSRVLAFWRGAYEWRRGTIPIPHLEGAMANLLPLLEMGRDLGAGDSRDKIYAFLGISNEGVQAELAHDIGLARIIQSPWMSPDVRVICPRGSIANPDAVRIPALLGVNPAWVPRYNRELTVEDVYHTFTTLMIHRQGGQLNVLSHVQWREGVGGISRPSWVPRWDQPRQVQMPFAQGHPMDLFWAHGGWFDPAGLPSVSPDVMETNSQMLRVPGYRLGRVVRCSDPIAAEADVRPPIDFLWLQIFGTMMESSHQCTPYRNGQRADSAFLATLAAGLHGVYRIFQANQGPLGVEHDLVALTSALRRPLANMKADMAAWQLRNLDIPATSPLRPSLVAEAVGGDAWRYESAVVETTFGRRVFLTDTGYLGLGPRAMWVGDTAAVLAGGRVPFVLRESPSPASDVDGQWTLVGEAYVHDDSVMWGLMSSLARSGAAAGSAPMMETFCLT